MTIDKAHNRELNHEPSGVIFVTGVLNFFNLFAARQKSIENRQTTFHVLNYSIKDYM
jgi:hypothetical protein